MSAEPLAIVRASAWPSLFDCAHRFYWQNIVGIRGPGSVRAAIGTAVHAGTAVFDRARVEGREASIDEAVEASHETIAHPHEELYVEEELTPQQADTIAMRLTAKYCADIAPKNTYAAVELTCTALDVVTSHGIVRVTGTTDRVRVLGDGSDQQLGVSDIKTGSRATKFAPDGVSRCAVTSPHHLQLGIYTLMAEQAGGMRIDGPAEVIGLQTTKEAPCATAEVADVKTPLLGTAERPGLIEMAGQMLKEGLFPPNPSSKLCHPKYCAAYAAHCKFHG